LEKLAKLAIGALDRQLKSASVWSNIGHQVSTYFNWICNQKLDWAEEVLTSWPPSLPKHPPSVSVSKLTPNLTSGYHHRSQSSNLKNILHQKQKTNYPEAENNKTSATWMDCCTSASSAHQAHPLITGDREPSQS